MQICRDLGEAARFAAGYTAQAARESIRDHGAFFFAVSGGTTPRRYFEELAALGSDEGIAWDKWRIFWADERCVARNDPLSNYRLAKDALLARVAIPEANIHPAPTGEASPQAAAAAYEQTLRRELGEAAAFPRFDLIHLGMGADGHTVSLFPGAPALAETKRWTAWAAEDGLKPKVPRITLTLPVLNAARRVLFLIAGEYKIALAKRIAGGRETAALPAAMVAPDGEVVWVAAQ
ncbi:MAG: 6-phosphogluconolactonase [Desulfovibrionaceae bacterium]|nr:6-phosphogluconolactonase [Desulfovibrionaceae bacterium]